MKGLFRFLFEPMQSTGFLKLFFLTLALLVGMIFLFIRPGQLQAGDFMLIAWFPGRELLETGRVYAEYPYPLWTVVVMLPFVIWEPQTAMLLMLVANLVMLAASIALLLPMFDWELSPALFATMVFISGLFLPVLTSLWIGQLTIFSLLILALTFYFYLHKRWVWLGIMLGLSFIKPQIMLLLAGLLLLWSLWTRRWQVLFGFGTTILVLVSISLPFISAPSQIIGGGISAHLGTFLGATSTVWGVSISMGIPWIVPFIFSLALMLWLGWVWLPFIRGENLSTNRVLFLFSAATMVNLIAVPYSWMHNLALLLLPLIYCLSMLYKLKSTARGVWFIVVLLITHPLMVVVFFTLSLPSVSQAYQGIPALLLLPIMIFFENKKHNPENRNVQPTV